jgi:Ran GTPase-activating protein (RanGAP) involved in mRNA processing and transport
MALNDEQSQLLNSNSQRSYATAEQEVSNLLPQSEDVDVASVGALSAATRWLYRGDLFTRFLLGFILRARLDRSCVSLDNDYTRTKVSVTTALYQGVRSFTDLAWPLSFYGLLLHDLIEYGQHPQSRYGTTLGKILAGTANNDLTISSWLGSDNIRAVNYWLAPGLLITLPPIFLGILQGLLHSKRHLGRMGNLDRRLTRALPWGELKRAEFALLWDKKLDDQTRSFIIGKIIELAQDYRGLVAWRAMQVLANVADMPSQNTIEFSAELEEAEPLNSKSVTRTTEAVSKSALKALQEIATSAKTRVLHPKRLYANYLLGTLGQHPSRLLTLSLWPFYGLQAALVLYPLGRLIGLWLQKLIHAVQFKHAQQTCEKQQRVWSYVSEIADYDCMACDLPSIPLRQRYTAQGCLDGLLGQIQSPSDLLPQLDRLLRQPNITRVDLSQQSWSSWTPRQWSDFLSVFEQADIAALEVFDLSQSVNPGIPMTDHKMARLADFLQQVPVYSLDLRNQPLGAEAMQELRLGLMDGWAHTIDLSQTNLADEGVAILVKTIDDNSALTTVKLRGNKITNAGLERLAYVLPNSTVTKLDISDNLFKENGVMALADKLRDASITYLDISDNNLSVNAIQALGSGLADSFVSTLKLSNTGLSDTHLYYFSSSVSESLLQEVDLSSNRFTDNGLNWLWEAMRNGTVAALQLADNALTDSSLLIINTYQQEVALTHLDLSRNHFTSSAFDKFLGRLTGTLLKSFTANGNRLNDDIAPGMARFINSTASLQQLSLEKNRLTHRFIRQVQPFLNGSNVTALNLANNELSNQAVIDLLGCLPFDLSSLNLSYNRFNGSVCQPLTKYLIEGGSLEKLNLSGNLIGDEAGLVIANGLIKSIPNQDHYTKSAISRDEARYIPEVGFTTQLRYLGLRDTNMGNDTVCLLHNTQHFSDLDWQVGDDRYTCLPENTRASRRNTQGLHSLGFFSSQSSANTSPAVDYRQTQTQQVWGSAFTVLAWLTPMLLLLLSLYLIYRLVSAVSQRMTPSQQPEPSPSM